MITFLTLYLGLITGPRPFELSVSETTARVEILLDGELQTEIEAPPWKFEIDLGDVPLPRELVAVAYDEEGAAVGRAFQRLNVSHPPVEVVIALESEGGRVRSARLAWEAAADEALTGVRVRLNGQRIPAEDPAHIPLPGLDPDSVHHLSAEVTFKRRLRTQVAVLFGGAYIDQVDSELTAVAVERLSSDAAGGVPSKEEVAGWFERRGKPLSVFAVEWPSAEVIVIRDKASTARLRRFLGVLGASRPAQTSNSKARKHLLDRRVRDLGVGLEGDDWLRVMATQPERRPETGKAFFRASGNVLSLARGLGVGIAGLKIQADDRPERLADAVAASALEVSGGSRRRAVILVTDPKTRDGSALTPHNAQRYLSAMRVPLEVWTAGDTEAVQQVWGTPRDISKPKRLFEAVEGLKGRLDSQLVIWLKGRLLPSEIELSAQGRQHVTFPRMPPAGGSGS